MRTIILESDGHHLDSHLIDKATSETLKDVVRIEFSDLHVHKTEPWVAILHFIQLDNALPKASEEVYIQVSPRVVIAPVTVRKKNYLS